MSRPSAITSSAFVRIWQLSPSAKAAAEALGMTRVGARSRAREYRRRGIDLKRFSSSAAQDHLDITGLRKLARSLRQGAR